MTSQDQPSIDLRGDSSAQPTEAMRSAMRDAPPGAYGGEDQSIRELESTAAEMFGKEAAIFLPTVTMANLIAVMHACRPGEEVIVDHDAHIYRNEASGITRLAGVLPQVVARAGALPAPAEVRNRLTEPRIHAERIGLVWAENTHETAGGAVASRADLDHLAEVAHVHGARLAIDGARIFNAATFLDTSVADLVRSADAVAVGITKALAVPAGALLVGDAALIGHAMKLRRLLGGSIKKAGPLAAACLVAFQEVLPDLQRDHDLAAEIASIVEETEGLSIETPVVTNLLRIDTSGIGPATACGAGLARHGVLARPSGPFTLRLATHRSIHPADMDRIGTALRSLTTLRDQTRLRTT